METQNPQSESEAEEIRKLMDELAEAQDEPNCVSILMEMVQHEDIQLMLDGPHKLIIIESKRNGCYCFSGVAVSNEGFAILSDFIAEHSNGKEPCN